MENSKHTISCSRCGEVIESEVKLNKVGLVVKLSLREELFINSKFKGPLCVPCVNQLKISYRIINGHYNVSVNQDITNSL